MEWQDSIACSDENLLIHSDLIKAAKVLGIALVDHTSSGIENLELPMQLGSYGKGLLGLFQQSRNTWLPGRLYVKYIDKAH